jgi:hypothetical protein
MMSANNASVSSSLWTLLAIMAIACLFGIAYSTPPPVDTFPLVLFASYVSPLASYSLVTLSCVTQLSSFVVRWWWCRHDGESTCNVCQQAVRAFTSDSTNKPGVCDSQNPFPYCAFVKMPWKLLCMLLKRQHNTTEFCTTLVSSCMCRQTPHITLRPHRKPLHLAYHHANSCCKQRMTRSKYVPMQAFATITQAARNVQCVPSCLLLKTLQLLVCARRTRTTNSHDELARSIARTQWHSIV